MRKAWGRNNEESRKRAKREREVRKKSDENAHLVVHAELLRHEVHREVERRLEPGDHLGKVVRDLVLRVLELDDHLAFSVALDRGWDTVERRLQVQQLRPHL